MRKLWLGVILAMAAAGGRALLRKPALVVPQVK
jgi:hypothetical protein